MMRDREPYEKQVFFSTTVTLQDYRSYLLWYNGSICYKFQLGESVALSNKRKALYQCWLQHYEIIENHHRNGKSVNHVHCRGVLKMHVWLVLASSFTSGGSLMTLQARLLFASCSQKAAIKFLWHNPTSSACERNWSVSTGS